MIPVSVRTAEERGTFGNRVSTMAVAIPTDLADPLERLRAAHEAMRSAKEHHKAVPGIADAGRHAVRPARASTRARRA